MIKEKAWIIITAVAIAIAGALLLVFSLFPGITSGKGTDDTVTANAVAVSDADSAVQTTTAVADGEAVQVATSFLDYDLTAYGAYELDFTKSAELGNVTASISLNDSGIKVSGDGSAVNVSGSTVHILAAGTYEFSGSLSDGQIHVVADKGNVVLVLNGVDVSNDDDAALYVEDCKNCWVYLAAGS
ncbi:MAG: carbohydrate-binding domain-containing protein, partial [Coriobacteriales bacterium]|nr:carbohydrate-binding domain-containing protein [Coriobacteriales bacterium]